MVLPDSAGPKSLLVLVVTVKSVNWGEGSHMDVAKTVGAVPVTRDREGPNQTLKIKNA